MVPGDQERFDLEGDLLRITGPEVADRDRLLDQVFQGPHPAADDLGDLVVDHACAGVELVGHRHEEIAPGEHGGIHVGEVGSAERPQARKAGWRSVRRGDDPFLEDLTSERDGVELELLLGAEVPVEPRLAHAQVVSQATDRRAPTPPSTPPPRHARGSAVWCPSPSDQPRRTNDRVVRYERSYETEVPMSAVQTSTHVQRYFDAWNAHDPDAIVAAFVEGGTYTDPNVGRSTTDGRDVGGLRPRTVRCASRTSPSRTCSTTSGHGATCARWLMRGTNTGGMRWPPSGQAIALPGVDVITTTDDGVSSVEGYFDRQTMFEQLGLQVLVQLRSAGPFRFGYGLKTETETADPPVPGAITLTWIATRSEAEADEVRALTRPLAAGCGSSPDSSAGWASGSATACTRSPRGRARRPHGKSWSSRSTSRR